MSKTTTGEAQQLRSQPRGRMHPGLVCRYSTGGIVPLRSNTAPLPFRFSRTISTVSSSLIARSCQNC